MATVTWTQDINGSFEVSSPEHLKQIMNNGSLYTNAGTIPPNFSSASYIQTTDIDLLNDTTDIVPIVGGGVYDGNLFSISNWSYLDPEFQTTAECIDRVGLFGTVTGTVKNLRMTGVCTLSGFKAYAGMVVGYLNLGNMFNVEADLSPGSGIFQGNVGTSSYVARIGGIAGQLQRECFVEGVTLRGTLDIVHSNGYRVGGVFGDVVYSTIELIQNLATFPSGIVGSDGAGGIAGRVIAVSGYTLTNPISCLNAMKGDITSTGNAGGIFGETEINISSGNTPFEKMVNAMTGNITGNYSGGIVGFFGSFGTYIVNEAVNYMTGNISAGSIYCGGMFGRIAPDGGMTITSSINAMNGDVDKTVVGSGGTGVVVTVDTTFGMTFNSNSFSTSTAPAGLLTDPTFTSLPYIEMTGTDPDGTAYDLGFVFSNLSGNASFSQYTHLTLHKQDVNAPFHIDFDINPLNTVTYLTYSNVPNATSFTDATLVVLSTSETISVFDYTGTTEIYNGVPYLVFVQRALNIPISITAVTGAISYKITYQAPGGPEVTAVSGVTALEQNIVGVEPATEYTVRLYADTGTGYELTDELTTTTLANEAANYDVSDLTQDGVIQLNNFSDSSIANIIEVMNEIFNTGDLVGVSVSEKPMSFINLGDTLSIGEIDGVLLPFVEATSAGQAVTVELSDGTTTVDVNFDEVVNTITVNGVVYSPGDSFILDGKKVTVLQL